MENQVQIKDVEPRPVWKRGLLMLLFVIAFGLAQMLLNALAIVQFVWLLVKREPNQPVAGFGMSLSKWLADVAQFLTCATDERPFPWRPRAASLVDCAISVLQMRITLTPPAPTAASNYRPDFASKIVIRKPARRLHPWHRKTGGLQFMVPVRTLPA